MGARSAAWARRQERLRLKRQRMRGRIEKTMRLRRALELYKLSADYADLSIIHLTEDAKELDAVHRRLFSEGFPLILNW
jgi:hypothetical protein